jgi:hypothetical protein
MPGGPPMRAESERPRVIGVDDLRAVDPLQIAPPPRGAIRKEMTEKTSHPCWLECQPWRTRVVHSDDAALIYGGSIYAWAMPYRSLSPCAFAVFPWS